MAITADEVHSADLNIEKPMPGFRHAFLQIRLGSILTQAAGERFYVLSELDLILQGRPIRPDLCIYPTSIGTWRELIGRMTTPPLLAVEIDSPTSIGMDIDEKLSVYHAGGVSSVWNVNPALQCIAIFEPGRIKPRVVSAGVARDDTTGLEVNVDELFR